MHFGWVAQAKKRAKPLKRLTQNTLGETCVDVLSEATSSDKIVDVWRPLVHNNHPLYVEGVFVVIKSFMAMGLEEGLEGLEGLVGGVLGMER
jgi:hypothetical protein